MFKSGKRINGFLKTRTKHKKQKLPNYLKYLHSLPPAYVGRLQLGDKVYAIKDMIPHKRYFIDKYGKHLTKVSNTGLTFSTLYNRKTGEVFCNKMGSFKFMIETPELKNDFDKFHCIRLFYDVDYRKVPLDKLLKIRAMFYHELFEYIPDDLKKHYNYKIESPEEIHGFAMEDFVEGSIKPKEMLDITKEFEEMLEHQGNPYIHKSLEIQEDEEVEELEEDDGESEDEEEQENED